MELSSLIRHSQLMEATKCGIYNTLKKFRPDLEAEMAAIPGLDVRASVQFLQDKGMWDERAEKLLQSFLMWKAEFQGGPDKETKELMMKRMNELMCYVADLIRKSV
jgi:hypothetical protein